MNFLKASILKFVFFLVGNLPFPILYLLSDFLSFLIQNVFKYRVQLVEKNLRLSNLKLNEKEIINIRKKFYRHFCDLALEMIKLDHMSENQIKKRFTINNNELTDKYLSQGKSVILMLSHYGGYEWCVALDYYLKHKICAVYTPLKDKTFEKVVFDSRTKHNLNLIPRYSAIDDIINLETSNKRFCLNSFHQTIKVCFDGPPRCPCRGRWVTSRWRRFSTSSSATASAPRSTRASR